MENSKTKFRPILFSTPMVQAILENRKTMTRRVVKPQPESIDFYEDRNVWFPEVSKCPYEVGDVLWVRETFYKTIAEELKGAFFYKADIDKLSWTFKWKPSLFMPKEACRIFLEIKSIKVERLKDISREDARSEGIERDLVSGTKYKNYVDGTSVYSEQGSFYSLWEKINGKESLTQNPFVFVYEFEQIEKPLDFA